MRCSRASCRAMLEVRIDAIGRVREHCAACARREEGLCAGCPRRVDGTIGKAKWCAACRRRAGRAACAKWEKNVRDLRPSVYEARLERERERAWRKRGALSEKERKARMREGGRYAGKVRADNLSPERRKEIARRAAQTRWDRVRRREAARAAHR